MKILYDYQTFTLQKYGGISRYFYEMIKYFNKEVDIKVFTSIIISNNHYISDKKDIGHINFFTNNEFRGKKRLITPINKFFSIINIKKQNFDVFHPTYYDTYFLKYNGCKPFVVTVYDMIHEKFKDKFSLIDKTSENKKLLCDKAAKIIAISQNTKNDLIEIFNIEESKIEVIYLGNSLIINDNNMVDFNLPKRYILFVGSRSGYKNFNRFIKAISDILNTNIDLSVVCVGGGKFKNEEIKLFNSLGIINKIFQYSSNDNKLSLFYTHAELFVFSSLYEGFGIPVLEAFACKCPLVCSNTSSLPEIAGDGAEYFDPYSEDSINQAIKNVLDSDTKKEKLINKATNRLKKFSWAKTAEQTKKVYESIIK